MSPQTHIIVHKITIHGGLLPGTARRPSETPVQGLAALIAEAIRKAYGSRS
ncbi:hypothetical protein ACFLU6_14120 [Acidobacteriota bacterium]